MKNVSSTSLNSQGQGFFFFFLLFFTSKKKKKKKKQCLLVQVLMIIDWMVHVHRDFLITSNDWSRVKHRNFGVCLLVHANFPPNMKRIFLIRENYCFIYLIYRCIKLISIREIYLSV
jgi:hypothetical protein